MVERRMSVLEQPGSTQRELTIFVWERIFAVLLS
jgi:hypothetical protein